jgi:non-heme chloroperoxidase
VTISLKNAIHIGHSTGGGEVTRYVARYGKGRVAKAVLISAIPPTFMKSDRNPDGVPREVTHAELINADLLNFIKTG